MNLQLIHTSSLTFHAGAARLQDLAEFLVTGTRRLASAVAREVAHLVAYVAALPREAAERAQLVHCSDRELADMGLARGDIGRVHDPRFAADHATGRALTESLKWL